MKTKENKKIYLIFVVALIITVLLILNFINRNSAFAVDVNEENTERIKISNAANVNIYEIIAKNTSDVQKEEIETREEILEFITKYKTNKELPKGTMQVLQEGRQGLQKISTKKIYKNGELINEEQISAKVTKASIDKIVEIGGAVYSNNHEVNEGENVYVTAKTTGVMQEPNESSRKLATLTKNDKLKVIDINEQWYKISNSSIIGWVKKESTTHIDPNAKYEEPKNETSKEKLVATVSFDMSLNKPSGLNLEQFKKVLTDSKDKYKTFEDNAEYFYYIEKQYNINGLFVAAIGIHESAWGTSKIARNKNNLFGYGAYDSNPYNGAYSFASISESVDLMARVLTKYYLNPAGTAIYNGEVAKGTYYNGPTFSGVNTKYATDKNWAKGVYAHFKYLYEKL